MAPETRLNDDPQQHQSDDDCSMMREDSSDDGGDDGQASVDDGNDQQSEDDDDDRSEYSYYQTDEEDDGTGGEGCAVSMTDVPMAAAPVAGVKRKGKGAIKGEGSYIKVMICCVTLCSLGLGDTLESRRH